MNIYIFAIVGLIVGTTLGWLSPFHIPISYANYTSVAVLAALDFLCRPESCTCS